MTKLLSRIVSNFIALYLADYFLDGLVLLEHSSGLIALDWIIKISPTFITLIIAALALTVLNAILRPLLKLFFGPMILLTLGLFTFAINAAMLYILDVLLNSLIIIDIETLLISTIIVGLVNLTFGRVFKKEKESN